MATKPSEYLGWTPSGLGSNVVDPSGSQKTNGWVGGEAPPCEYMNWLFWNTDQWIQWFDFITQEITHGAFYCESESDLTAAITGVTTNGGGTIVIAASFSVSSSHTLSVPAIILGSRGNTVITFTGGSLSLGSEIVVRDVFFQTSSSSGTLVTLSGNRIGTYNVKFTVPSSSTVVCMDVTGSENNIRDSIFVGVLAGSATGIQFELGATDNEFDRCAFE